MEEVIQDVKDDTLDMADTIDSRLNGSFANGTIRPIVSNLQSEEDNYKYPNKTSDAGVDYSDSIPPSSTTNSVFRDDKLDSLPPSYCNFAPLHVECDTVRTFSILFYPVKKKQPHFHHHFSTLDFIECVGVARILGFILGDSSNGGVG